MSEPRSGPLSARSPPAVELVRADVGDRAPDLLPDLDATIVTSCPNGGQVADRPTALG